MSVSDFKSKCDKVRNIISKIPQSGPKQDSFGDFEFDKKPQLVAPDNLEEIKVEPKPREEEKEDERLNLLSDLEDKWLSISTKRHQPKRKLRLFTRDETVSTYKKETPSNLTFERFDKIDSYRHATSRTKVSETKKVTETFENFAVKQNEMLCKIYPASSKFNKNSDPKEKSNFLLKTKQFMQENNTPEEKEETENPSFLEKRNRDKEIKEKSKNLFKSVNVEGKSFLSITDMRVAKEKKQFNLEDIY